MKERILQIMAHEQLGQAQFAAAIMNSWVKLSLRRLSASSAQAFRTSFRGEINPAWRSSKRS